jgi:hypothetical protein
MKTEAILTVSESKRLIAKAIYQMDIVQKAKAEGILVICGGTTNGYLAEEFLGQPVDKRAFRYGITLPSKPEKGMPGEPSGRKDLIFRNGQVDDSVDRIGIVPSMKRGDVFIKGANALDYKNKVAGILIANPTGGTVGAGWGRIYGSHIHLIIPVGLEKVIYGDIWDLARKTMAPEYIGPSLYPVTGTIVTEIAALGMLSGVHAELLSAGGVAGAEGSIRLYLDGDDQTMGKAKAVLEGVRGEPRFLM